MSNIVYPIGSLHHGLDLWERLPRIDNGVAEVAPSPIFIGLFWALVFEIGIGVTGWLLWELCR